MLENMNLMGENSDTELSWEKQRLDQPGNRKPELFLMDYTCNFLYFHAPFIIIELIKSFVTFVLPCLTPTLKYK